MTFSEFQTEIAQKPNIIRLYPVKFHGGTRGIDYMVTYQDDRFIVLRAYDHVLIDLLRKIVYVDGVSLYLFSDASERDLRTTLHNLTLDLIGRIKNTLATLLLHPDTSSDDLFSSSYDEIRRYYILGADWQSKIQRDTDTKIYAFAKDILEHNEFDEFRKCLLQKDYVPQPLYALIERTETLRIYTRAKVANLLLHIDAETEKRHDIIHCLQCSTGHDYSVLLTDGLQVTLTRDALLFHLSNSFLYYYPRILTDYSDDDRAKMLQIRVSDIKEIAEMETHVITYSSL